MKDNAVSPVIAFMLLLMIIVSFISVLNAYYIPSLKQQAEVQHLHSVEESFSKMSSDILQVLSFRQNMTMKEPVELGGGDILLSSLRSSGYLEVNTSLRDTSPSHIDISLNSKPVMESHVNSSKILYRPVGNFWVNQGYEWEDGVLNVTKGNRKTYLEYTDDTGKIPGEEKERYYKMYAPRIDLKTTPPTIRIDLVQIEDIGRNRSMSSNGAATIWIEMKESYQNTISLKPTDKLTFTFSGTDEDAIGLKSGVNKTFSQWSNNNQSIWESDNYTLNIVENNQKEYPNLTITLWNMSFI
ncbi:MAG TPA: hypothetical protein VN429_06595, partial [Methanospirillum sp.]|nr:hypothetical protein [Methanospirillum sp.]